MSHRFLPLLIAIWTCWLSTPEKAQARSDSFAHPPLDYLHLLAQADTDAGSSLLDESALDPESEEDTGSSLLEDVEEESPRALMQLGSEGPGVESVQQKLAELGYFSGTVDGLYSDTTAAAVQQFQETEGLEATGRIDLRTWERIQTSNKALVTETPPSESSAEAGEAETTPPSDSANPEAGAAPEQPAPAQAPEQADWTLKRILLIGGVAVFGLVAIAGMSLWVWKWFTQPSTQSDKALGNDVDNQSPVADLTGSDAAFHAINTTATPIGNGSHAAASVSVPASPPPEPYSEPIPAAESPSINPESVNHDAAAAIAKDIPSPEPTDGPQAGEANGSASLQPANVSPTTRFSKTNLIESLIQDLDNIDSTVRRKAIWQLGQQGTTQAIQPLVNLMIDSDSQQRSLILAALSEIGERTLNPMHRALALSLQDENAEVRKNAIRDLTRIYDQVAQLAPLLRHAMEDTDPTVRDTAAWALKQLNRQAKQTSFQPNSSPAQLNQSATQPDDLWQDS
ncbi:MAG: HEAT repeat domain-containing protein [Thainema sp.]